MEGPSSENRELQLAEAFVETTDCHIFLTGRAGTGKTTFLRRLKEKTAKRMVVTAPTGVAAINAGGVTLHSFFQLPFGPFLPGGDTRESNRFRFSREKKRILKSLDLLVIDEISMVRADLLDAVDASLRRHRRNEQPFGGVQLLLIGDLHQLSPVAKSEEWQLLSSHYDSVYFFSSHALGRTDMVTVELQHIYRQSDARFIHLLNRIRDNRLEADDVRELSRRCIQDFAPEKEPGHIVLTTHNRSADTINGNRLAALAGEAFDFEAEISGEFSESAFPAPGRLTLKTGAQVMFLRNDSVPEKRYFNGKIGRIAGFSEDQIHIRCEGEAQTIDVDPVEWQNIQYSVNPETGEIREEVIGLFKQFPLKPAWAITIHKSQGLTFDKAVIDAAAAFAAGQVYVALSRCRTLEGMVLSSPIPSRGLGADGAVLDFLRYVRQTPPTEERLLDAQHRYQQKLLLSCFDFRALGRRLNYLAGLLLGNAGRIQIVGISDPARLRETAEAQIVSVGEKFRQQLRSLFRSGTLPEADPQVQERIGKASAWFQERFAAIFDDLERRFSVETDNKEIGKKIDTALSFFKQEIAVKRAGVLSCAEGFSPSRYLRALSRAEIEAGEKKKAPSPASEYGESDIAHPELFRRLKAWRAGRAADLGFAHYQVLHQRVLIQIAVTLPGSLLDLMAIKGVGKKTLEKYGEEILALVADYREKEGIETVAAPEVRAEKEEKAPDETDKPQRDTRQASLELFHQGLSVDRIAKERGLAESTVYGHLGFFVEKGEMDVDRVLSPEKRTAIEAAMDEDDTGSLKAVKTALGDAFSYGEIRLVGSHRKYLSRQED